VIADVATVEVLDTGTHGHHHRHPPDGTLWLRRAAMAARRRCATR